MLTYMWVYSLAGIDRVDPYAVINKAKGFGMKIWSTESEGNAHRCR